MLASAVVITILSVSSIAVFITAAWFVPGTQRNLGMFAATLLGMSCFGIHLLYNWHWSGPGRRYAARAMAADGVCPACGYGVAGVPAGTDGLTICPECAAAWRVGLIAACGNCGYDLMGTKPDERGAMMCPECSWEWHPTREQPIPSPR